MDQMAEILEPLAELEREGYLSDQEQETISAYLQELSELDYQLASVQSTVELLGGDSQQRLSKENPAQ